MKSSVSIKFVEFWATFDVLDNPITRALQRHRSVEVIPTESSEVPDILFYSRCGKGEHYSYDCLKVYYTGENDFPNFNECDYAISFYKSDCGGRNLRFPLYMFYEVDEAISPKILTDKEALERPFASLVLSNNYNCHPRRLEIINAIETYKPLHYGGAYRNNVGRRVEDKIKFISDYKFNLAFENSIMPGYVTEKILEPFAASTVPIYWGSSDALIDFNPKSFINVSDYRDYNQLIKFIHHLDNNDDDYLEMLRSPNFVRDTVDRMTSQLEEFLNRIADNPTRIIQNYGEIANKSYLNTLLIPLSYNKNFMRAVKLLRKFIK